MPLTDYALKTAKPKEKAYKLTDGRGLFVLITPMGSKLFRQKYRIDGKEKLLALGAYPEVSLKDARQRCDEARQLIQAGEDPSLRKRLDKLERRVRAATTFEDVAREYIASKAVRHKPDHLKYSLRRLEQNIFADLGKRPIADIEPPELLAVLRKIEDRGAHEMKTRVKGLCSQVFRYGIATGKCKRDPVSDLRGALLTHKVRHMPAIAPKELPELLGKIDRYDGEPVTRLGLLMLAHTFLRTQELIGAEWSEFDIKGELWTVPGPRMKMKRDHLVPLTAQTLKIIEQLRAFNGGSRYVFSIHNPRKHMSTNTLIFALYRLGYKGRMCGHGFRRVANTILNMQMVPAQDGHEVKRFDSDWIERQMAHSEADEIRGAYNMAEYLPQRIRMMKWYSSFLDEALKAGKEAL